MGDMRFKAFDQAVRRWQRRVFTFATYFLGDPSEAEEVTQEVLVRLWRHPEVLESDRIEGWLMRVTRNCCLDSMRRVQARRRLVDDCPAEDRAPWSVDGSPDPERRAASVQLRDHVAVALTRLSEPQRSVVILREIHGLSYQEIADAVEISLSNVRVALHRGRRRLREELEEVRDHVVAV